MGMMCYYCMQATLVNGRCSCCGRSAADTGNAGAQSVLAPGTTLDEGNITVGQVLGQGGFGITYIARDRTCGLIALKEFFPRNIAKREGSSVVADAGEENKFARFMADFKREVKHLLNLHNHPNIVTVLFDLSENNTFYYGMELLQGESLRAYIQRYQKLDPHAALKLLEPIFDALSFAHQHMTLHRDIAPDNIFLRRNPADSAHSSPCLIDFGAAFTDKDGFTYVAPSVKKNGYSPPDQVLPFSQQGPFIDVYALTATYYTMVTGRIPPSSADRQQMPLRAASSLNPAVSSRLDEVIARGMELNHEKRYQSVEALRQHLHQALEVDQRPLLRPALLQCRRGPMQGSRLQLREQKNLIGREGALKIVGADMLASRKHCSINEEGGSWYLVDLKSHNGTRVNHTLISPNTSVQLTSGDIILIGQEEFVFTDS